MRFPPFKPRLFRSLKNSLQEEALSLPNSRLYQPAAKFDWVPSSNLVSSGERPLGIGTLYAELRATKIIRIIKAIEDEEQRNQ